MSKHLEDTDDGEHERQKGLLHPKLVKGELAYIEILGSSELPWYHQQLSEIPDSMS